MEARLFKILPDSIVGLRDASEYSFVNCRFSGETPDEAAEKAFTRVRRTLGLEECKFQYKVRDDQSGRVYSYKGEYVKTSDSCYSTNVHVVPISSAD